MGDTARELEDRAGDAVTDIVETLWAGVLLQIVGRVHLESALREAYDRGFVEGVGVGERAQQFVDQRARGDRD